MCPARIPTHELKESFHKDVMRFGEVPTRDKQNKNGTYTGHTYAKRFGSWSEALKKLGYPVHKHSGTTEVDCYHCGKTVEKYHYEIADVDDSFCSRDCLDTATIKIPCKVCDTDFETNYIKGNRDKYCSETCRKKFVRVQFHCDNCDEQARTSKWKKENQTNIYCSEKCSHESNSLRPEDCIDAFKKGVEEVGTDAILHDVMTAGGMGAGQAYRHFDSYNNIAREAGYPEMCGHAFVECQTCGYEVKKIRAELERYEHHFCDQTCYFEWVRSGGLRSSDTVYDIEYGPNWYVQRRAARARDDYKCRTCGMSEREHKSEYGSRLDVHHIKKARLFDDHKARNDLKNLLTLCKRCHKKWEHMGVRPQLVD